MTLFTWNSGSRSLSRSILGLADYWGNRLSLIRFVVCTFLVIKEREKMSAKNTWTCRLSSLLGYTCRCTVKLPIYIKEATSRFVPLEKFSLNFSSSLFAICVNLLHTQPSSVLLWFNFIISLVFCYLCKQLFSGFLQFKVNFLHGQNNSKYRE